MLLFLLGMAAGGVVCAVAAYFATREAKKGPRKLDRIDRLWGQLDDRIDSQCAELGVAEMKICRLDKNVDILSEEVVGLKDIAELLRKRTESLLEYANSCIDCHETAFHAPPAAQAKKKVIKKDK